jgi:acyl carrier protein
MTTLHATDLETATIYPQVARIIAEALGVDADHVQPELSLIEDLNAESIDFLDIVFRLERAFDVKIPRGAIIQDARGALSESEFEQRGALTAAGLARLRAFLSEVPPERFRSPMRSADIPRLFTAETFCKVVLRASRAARAAS